MVRENTGYKYLSPFVHCFQRPSSSKSVELQIGSEEKRLTLYHAIPTFNDPKEGDF